MTPFFLHLHQSVFAHVMRFLTAAEMVRLASCCRCFREQARYESRIPVARERLKHACWNLLHAGNSVRLRDTVAYDIEMVGDVFTFRYFERASDASDASDASEASCLSTCREYSADRHDVAAFSSAFDRFVLSDVRARMHMHRCGGRRRSTNDASQPSVRSLASSFAKCARVLSGLSPVPDRGSLTRPWMQRAG